MGRMISIVVGVLLIAGIVGMATGSLETDTFNDLIVTLGAGQKIEGLFGSV